ncbi:hypothetical protein C8R45DRAFT_927136 [Mycena sanguinolenta]|nr:hypothetical protein C8R45DRAFT_927136 [Mycena sanguinolenta]
MRHTPGENPAVTFCGFSSGIKSYVSKAGEQGNPQKNQKLSGQSCMAGPESNGVVYRNFGSNDCDLSGSVPCASEPLRSFSFSTVEDSRGGSECRTSSCTGEEVEVTRARASCKISGYGREGTASDGREYMYLPYREHRQQRIAGESRASKPHPRQDTESRRGERVQLGGWQIRLGSGWDAGLARTIQPLCGRVRAGRMGVVPRWAGWRTDGSGCVVAENFGRRLEQKPDVGGKCGDPERRSRREVALRWMTWR